MYTIARYRITPVFKSILKRIFSAVKILWQNWQSLTTVPDIPDFAWTSLYSVVLTLLDLCTDISGTRPWQILRSSFRAERVQGVARSVEHDQRRNWFRRSSVARPGTTRSANIFPRGRQGFRLKYFCPTTNQITKF